MCTREKRQKSRIIDGTGATAPASRRVSMPKTFALSESAVAVLRFRVNGRQSATLSRAGGGADHVSGLDVGGRPRVGVPFHPRGLGASGGMDQCLRGCSPSLIFRASSRASFRMGNSASGAEGSAYRSAKSLACAAGSCHIGRGDGGVPIMAGGRGRSLAAPGAGAPFSFAWIPQVSCRPCQGSRFRYRFCRGNGIWYVYPRTRSHYRRPAFGGVMSHSAPPTRSSATECARPTACAAVTRP